MIWRGCGRLALDSTAIATDAEVRLARLYRRANCDWTRNVPSAPQQVHSASSARYILYPVTTSRSLVMNQCYKWYWSCFGDAGDMCKCPVLPDFSYSEGWISTWGWKATRFSPRKSNLSQLKFRLYFWVPSTNKNVFFERCAKRKYMLKGCVCRNVSCHRIN